MARVFVAGSSQYLEVNSTPITAAPMTVSAWIYPGVLNVVQVAVWIGNSGSSSDYWALLLSNTGTAQWLARRSTQGTSNGGFPAQNQWSHICGVEYASNNRNIYTNGAAGTADTTNLSPAGANRLAVGRFADSSPGGYWTGRIAEVGIWNVALTAAEIAALARGYSPLMIRPGSLAAYLDLVRDEDEDRVGGLSLTAYGSPTFNGHGPRLFRAQPLMPSYTVVAGNTITAAAQANGEGSATAAGTVVHPSQAQASSTSQASAASIAIHPSQAQASGRGEASATGGLPQPSVITAQAAAAGTCSTRWMTGAGTASEPLVIHPSQAQASGSGSPTAAGTRSTSSQAAATGTCSTRWMTGAGTASEPLVIRISQAAAAGQASPTAAGLLRILTAAVAKGTAAITAEAIIPTQIKTPADRIIRIQPENRTITVHTEDRTIQIRLENRTTTIPSEHREITIQAEDRQIRIPAENRTVYLQEET